MKIETYSQPSQPVAYVRVRTSLDKLTTAFNENFSKIIACLAQMGQKPAGPPYAAYYNDDMQNLDVEMGFPVQKLLEDSGEVKFKALPAIENAITATHKGSYNTLSTTYAPLYKHIKQNSLSMTGPHYDFYLNDPDTTTESELMTRVVIPVSSEPMVYCQSCGMPMTEDGHFGTDKGGGKSEDYCVYCFKEGEFTADVTMDEMIGISIGHMKEMFAGDPSFDADTALENMRTFFPQLKRWKA